MTKGQLLKMLDDSTFKYDVTTSRLYDKYYPLIKRTLCFCADNVELAGFSSLNGFEKKQQFEEFLRSNDIGVIEDRLKALLTDLDTFSSQYIAANPDKVKSAGAVMYCQNELNVKAQHKIRNIVLVALFILFTAAVIVFTALDAGGVFADGTPMATACAVIAAVSGALDFVCGLTFFIYEHRDDQNKKAMAQAAERAIADDNAQQFIDKYPTVQINVIDRSKRKIKMGKGSKYIEDNHGEINFN